jgi:hypothetical protein
VRPCDASKQCLWLGPGQYLNGCRNTCANPNCFADSCVKCYAVRGVIANAYAAGIADGDSSAKPVAYTERATADTYCNANAKRASGKSNAASAQGNTEASSDATPAAVSSDSE